MRRFISLAIGCIALAGCASDSTAPSVITDGTARSAVLPSAASAEWEAQVIEIGPSRGGFQGINDAGVAVGTWGGAAWRWEAGSLTRLFEGEARSINNRGWVAGVSAPDDPGFPGATSAVLWHDGVIDRVRLPEWFGARAVDVNESGLLLGNFFMQSGPPFSGVFTANGSLVERPPLFPGATSVSANALGNDGTIVGSVQLNAPPHAFVYEDGALSELDTDTPSLFASIAVDVNANGTVLVTRAIGRPQPLAWLWRAGAFTEVPMPPQGFFSEGAAVNDAGVVVGRFAWVATGAPWQSYDLHAFVAEQGVATDLHAVLGPSALYSEARHVNARDEIVGEMGRRVGPPPAPIEVLPVVWRRIGVEARLGRLRDAVTRLQGARVLNEGQQASLLQKLTAAGRLWSEGIPRAAVETIRAFEQQVDALKRAGIIDTADAETIRTIVAGLIAAIERESVAG